MTSSVYPIIPSLAATTITTPGSGYTTTPTVTIDPPPSGTTATGTANIADGVIATISAIGGTNSGYTDGEEVTLSGGTGSDATAIAVITGGIIQSLAFTNRGSGFTATNTITITGVTSTTATATFTVDSIADDAVSSITLTNGGSGYTSVPNITITGGGGSGGTALGVFATRLPPIPLDSNILTSDIAIASELVSPGGGGILRLYFAFTFAPSGPGTIGVFNNGNLKGDLNADNDSQVIVDGYYRFDIDVEAGDNINLQLRTETATSITAINFFRAHLVQFGA